MHFQFLTFDIICYQSVYAFLEILFHQVHR